MLEQDQKATEGSSAGVIPALSTIHRILYSDSRNYVNTNASTPVDLVVTSPPYPMIEMWDSTFTGLNGEIQTELIRGHGDQAFELMHRELDKVWTIAYGNLRMGGIMCINVGDATRTIDGTFKVYSNHARILSFCVGLGFHALPEILWRKESNKPNKFMGSGMLPGSAYVTQEHEFILILRKDGKREFKDLDKQRRESSAFFWEERNSWFSDVWEDLKGAKQALNYEHTRERSAAFPFDLAYRLISMFSVKGDWVIDPFLGTGTTTLACMALNRNSLGFELDRRFKSVIERRISRVVDFANDYNRERISRHLEFVRSRKERPLHQNDIHDFPVMTAQERVLEIPMLKSIGKSDDNTFETNYINEPLKVGRFLF